MEIARGPRILVCVLFGSLLLAPPNVAALAAAMTAEKAESPPEAPGFATWLKAWVAISSGKVEKVQPPKQMPEGVELEKDLEYGRVGERALKLDLYKPAKVEKPVPGLVFIHGGAWAGGNKSYYRPYAARYAKRGYVAISISYRLSGEAPFPAAVEDAKCAVRWMRANAGKYGVDPDNICVLGGSAGGHLALMLAYTHGCNSLEGDGGHREQSSKVQAVVSFYGPTDLAVPPMRDAGVVRKFLGGKKYADAPEIYRRASPMTHLTGDDPPTLILHGTLDKLVSIKQSDKLAERLKELKIPYDYDRLEGWPHAMDIAKPVFDRCAFFIDRFLARHMPVPEPVVVRQSRRRRTSGDAAGDSDSAYLFTSFRGNGEDGLHMAYSLDGYRWTDLERVFLRPRVGKSKLMRDPCLIQGPDGVFHMVWTTGWWEKGIGYAKSTDLINWSEQKYIEVMAHEPDAKNCWAPEIFYDNAKAQYLIFWATTIPGRFPDTERKGDNNHRIYYVTTKDLKSFSRARLFYEHGFNVIDSTIIRDNGRYLMFLKDETLNPPQKNIRLATAAAAEGPYSKPSEPITGQYWAEGPTAVKIGDTWFVYFDKYRKHSYGVVTSRDLKSWKDVSDKLEFPKGSRHGTVLEVSKSVLDRLLKVQ